MTAFERERILLVDDDASLLVGMEAVLADYFEVRTCTSARVALYLLQRETFHVVCSDWQMPGMTGIELYQAMVNGDSPFEPSFILMSAHALDFSNEGFARAGLYVTYLRKPIAAAELLRVVTQSAGVAKVRESTGRIRLGARPARRLGG